MPLKTKAIFGLISYSSSCIYILYIVTSTYCMEVIVHLSFQRSRGLPMGLLPLGVLFTVCNTKLVFSRRRTCSSKHTSHLLDMPKISGSSYISLNSLFKKTFMSCFLEWDQNSSSKFHFKMCIYTKTRWKVLSQPTTDVKLGTRGLGTMGCD